MMSVTAQDIISRAYKRTDTPEPSTSRTDSVGGKPEMLEIVNEGLAQLHDILVDTYQDWLVKLNSSLSMTAATRTTALPDDFYKLKALFLLDSGQRVEVEYFDLLDMSGSETSDSTDRPRYHIVGQDIVWHPSPSTTQGIEMWYVRQFRKLTSTDSKISPEIPPEWEVVVVAHCAKYLLEKQEMDATPALRDLATGTKRIASAAANRDASRPRRVRDRKGRFDGRGRRNRRRYPYPRS